MCLGKPKIAPVAAPPAPPAPPAAEPPSAPVFTDDERLQTGERDRVTARRIGRSRLRIDRVSGAQIAGASGGGGVQGPRG